MKKILVIGSTVVDVIINLDRLPKTQEDVHVLSQKMSLGGCAYNVSDMIRHFGVPYILFSPVGTGAYGDFVRARLAAQNITTPIPCPGLDNGCCYCFVEKNGERTFVSYHGAEYLFRPEWFRIPDPAEISSVYICGLEIEETTGCHIVEYLERHPEYQIYFAPGPRITKIDPALLNRLFALRPILHLNDEEALSYTALEASRRPSGTAFTAGTASGSPGPDPAGDPGRFRNEAEKGYAREGIGEAHTHDGAEEALAHDGAGETHMEEAQAAGTLAQKEQALKAAARALYRRTKAPIIITLGAGGTYYHTGTTSGLIPAFPAVQTDTIGAGDSHIGAVIACVHLGLSLPEAIRTANQAAAKVVETEGALLSDAAFAQIHFTPEAFSTL